MIGRQREEVKKKMSSGARECTRMKAFPLHVAAPEPKWRIKKMSPNGVLRLAFLLKREVVLHTGQIHDKLRTQICMKIRKSNTPF